MPFTYNKNLDHVQSRGRGHGRGGQNHNVDRIVLTLRRRQPHDAAGCRDRGRLFGRASMPDALSGGANAKSKKRAAVGIDTKNPGTGTEEE